MNLKSSDQWISNEKAGKYEIEFHAIARIYQLLKIANILCTTLTLLQNFIMHFNFRSDVYTIGGSSLPIPSMDA